MLCALPTGLPLIMSFLGGVAGFPENRNILMQICTLRTCTAKNDSEAACGLRRCSCFSEVRFYLTFKIFNINVKRKSLS